jgi:hypothetical protein
MRSHGPAIVWVFNLLLLCVGLGWASWGFPPPPPRWTPPPRIIYLPPEPEATPEPVYTYYYPPAPDPTKTPDIYGQEWPYLPVIESEDEEPSYFCHYSHEDTIAGKRRDPRRAAAYSREVDYHLRHHLLDYRRADPTVECDDEGSSDEDTEQSTVDVP